MKLIKTFIFITGLFLLGTTHVSASSDARIDKTHFPDPYLRNVVSGFDTNNDGILQAEEAEAVTELSISKFFDDLDDDYEGEIPVYKKEDFTFDFKGLGYFSNLSVLYINLDGGKYFTQDKKVYPVRISHLNSLYKLKNLEKLTIMKTDIKNFDVSNFPKLKKLSLYYFNNMEQISFKKNQRLKKLYIDGFGKLKKIVFGSGSKLEDIWISDMKSLDTVDISQLKKTKNFRISNSGTRKIITSKRNKSIKEFTADNYQYNKSLKSLDLQYLTNMERIVITNIKNLKKLNLDNNKKLKSIFIEGCTQLEELKPDQCKELEEVDIWGPCKNFKVLDLSANPALKYLIISHLKIETLLLHKDNQIEVLRYQYAGLSGFDIENINKNTLKILQLEGNKIKKLDLSGYTSLETLWIEDDVIVTGWNKPENKEISG